MSFPVGMSLNGNRFKLSDRSMPCPQCNGYPPLKPFEGRLRPECSTCDGRGSVPRRLSKPSSSEIGAGLRRALEQGLRKV